MSAAKSLDSLSEDEDSNDEFGPSQTVSSLASVLSKIKADKEDKGTP